MKKTLPWLSCMLWLFAAGIILGACASKDFKEPAIAKHKTFDTSRQFKAGFSSAWRATEQALQKYPIMLAKKDGGLIITDWISGKSDILYSGYGETRIPYSIRYRFTVKLKRQKKGTSVGVTVKEQYLSDAVTAGVDFSGSLYQWIDTKSSTHKENRLLDQIAKTLGEAK